MDIFITKEYIMKKIIKLTERNLTHIVRKVISEQAVDEKAGLIQVLTDKLESMKSNPQFTADDVCETIINNCNHFKNKTDIFAQTTKINEEEGSDKMDYKLLIDYFTLKNGFEYVGDKDGAEVYQLKRGGYRLIVAIKPSDEPFFVDLRVFVGLPMGETINYLKEVRGNSFMKVRMNDYGKILQALQGASDFGRAKSDYDNMEPLPKF